MKGLVNVVWICTVLAKYSSGLDTGDIRLVGGEDDYEGRVEIFFKDQWGTVDDDPWDNDDAGVVCRQLGYLFGGVAYKSAHFGEGSGPIWLDDIGCIGTETHLLDCPHQTDTSEDDHSEDVGVACNGKVRLVDGNGPDEGRVEIFLNGLWGTIDDDPWHEKDAGVICRQLGYMHGGIAYSNAHFGPGSGPIVLDDIGCVGNEPSFLNCSYGTDTSEDSHYEDVGVACGWSVRLANGSLASEGRVEVLINGQWGTINDDNWDDREAAVVCAQLGYMSGGIAYSGAHFGKGTGPLLLENLNCAGSETSFLHCPHRRVVSYRSHSTNAGVACFNLSNDMCYTQPCTNNGNCVNQIISFLCVCPIGFNGPRCENVIDSCDSLPCENNGLCIRERNDYRCICPDGVEGRRCESDSDPCNREGCKSSENCISRLNYRLCTCLDNSNDTILCQYEINACYSNPCTEKESCLSQGINFDCVTVENTKTTNSERITSTISLILATCALLAAAICLVMINKITCTLKEQRNTCSSGTKDDNVQMRYQHNQYVGEKSCAIGYDKEQQGASWLITSYDQKTDDGQDIYENYNKR